MTDWSQSKGTELSQDSLKNNKHGSDAWWLKENCLISQLSIKGDDIYKIENKYDSSQFYLKIEQNRNDLSQIQI